MWNGACARYCSLIARNISLLHSCIIIIHQWVYNNECDCRTQIIIIIIIFIIITISHDDVIICYYYYIAWRNRFFTRRWLRNQVGQYRPRWHAIYFVRPYPLIPRYTMASSDSNTVPIPQKMTCIPIWLLGFLSWMHPESRPFRSKHK